MFLEIVRSEGLAHLSYVLGDGGQAAVIDPRRDGEVYLELAYRHEAAITHIFETHRNEDYVVGSRDLAARSGAVIHRGRARASSYGHPVAEGDRFRLGTAELRVLETPGHTEESISLVLVDISTGSQALGVFSGDGLLIGGTGRTDLVPDRADEMAELLYESLFHKLLPLGDQALLYPAHSGGSVCGLGLAPREFSTLGYERQHNRALQLADREAFIRFKLSEQHYRPPYFSKMHEYNSRGSAPPLLALPRPRPLGPAAFAQAMAEGMLVLDVRQPEAVAGAHLRGSLTIPLALAPSFAGYFLPYELELGLIVERYADVEQVVRYLVRLGYDHVRGFLAGGISAWATSGRPYASVPALSAQELALRLAAREDLVLLDVRQRSEFQHSHLAGSEHIYVGELPQRLAGLSRDRPIVTFCSSGRRSTIAASLLEQQGFTELGTCLGSLTSCAAAGCRLIEGAE